MKKYAISSVVLSTYLIASPIALAQDVEVPETPATEVVTEMAEDAVEGATESVTAMAEEKAADVVDAAVEQVTTPDAADVVESAVDTASDTATEVIEEKAVELTEDASAQVETAPVTDTVASVTSTTTTATPPVTTETSASNESAEVLSDILDPFADTDEKMVSAEAVAEATETKVMSSDDKVMTVDDMDKMTTDALMADQEAMAKEKMLEAASEGKSIVFSESASAADAEIADETPVVDAAPASSAVGKPGQVKVIVKDADGNIVKEYYRDADETYSTTRATTTYTPSTYSPTQSADAATTDSASSTDTPTSTPVTYSATSNSNQFGFLRPGAIVTTSAGEELGPIGFVQKDASGVPADVWIQSIGRTDAAYNKAYRVPASEISLDGDALVVDVPAEALVVAIQ